LEFGIGAGVIRNRFDTILACDSQPTSQPATLP